MAEIEELSKKIEQLLDMVNRLTRVIKANTKMLTEINLHLENINFQKKQEFHPTLPPSLLRVLKLLWKEKSWLTPQEISERLGLLPETAYRYLTHLNIMGLVLKQRIRTKKEKKPSAAFITRIYKINSELPSEIRNLIQHSSLKAKYSTRKYNIEGSANSSAELFIYVCIVS